MPVPKTNPTAAVEAEPAVAEFELVGGATDYDVRLAALSLAVQSGQLPSIADELAAAEKYRAFLANDSQPESTAV